MNIIVQRLRLRSAAAVVVCIAGLMTAACDARHTNRGGPGSGGEDPSGTGVHEGERDRVLEPLGGALPHATAPVALEVTLFSPASRAGIIAGDTLLSVDGRPVGTIPELEDVIARRRGNDAARVVVGTPEGRREVDVTPTGTPPSIGVHGVGARIAGNWIQVADAGVGVQARVEEWAGITLVHVQAMSGGDRTIAFGPESVVLVDGFGTTFTPMPVEGIIDRVYGPDPGIETAKDPGRDAELQQQRDVIRDLRAHAMGHEGVPPDSSAQGIVFFGQAGLAAPVTVRVTLAGQVYSMFFGRRGP